MSFWARRPAPTNLIGAIVVIAATWAMFELGMAIGFPDAWGEILLYGTLTVASLGVARWYDHLPAAWVGLGAHRWLLRELGQGALLGLGMAVIAWLPIALLGSVTLDVERLTAAYPLAVALYIFRAAGEEVLFRGYLFQRLMEIVGPVAATVLASILFAILHFVGDRSATPISVFNLVLAGVLFTLGYLKTGSLWLPIAAHAAWNISIGLVVGLPVSGIDLGPSIFSTVASGPDVITGGAFGPEGSLVATAALLGGIAAIALLDRITLSPYVHAEIFRALYRNQTLRQADAGPSGDGEGDGAS